MNVTEKKSNTANFNKEGLLQKDSAEHEGYAGVYSSSRITENNITNTNKYDRKDCLRKFWTETT